MGTKAHHRFPRNREAMEVPTVELMPRLPLLLEFVKQPLLFEFLEQPLLLESAAPLNIRLVAADLLDFYLLLMLVVAALDLFVQLPFFFCKTTNVKNHQLLKILLRGIIFQ
jgi:hypothetical protein